MNTIQKESHADIAQALLDADIGTARGALFAAMDRGDSVGELCDGPIAGALHNVGERWKHGEEGIISEHQTTVVAIELLVYLRMRLPIGGGESPVAIGGTPGGDVYQLPSMMVGAIFASEGWREINFGPDVTVSAYVSSIQLHRPSAMWISFSVDEAALRFVENWKPLLEEAEHSGVTLFVGGRAFPPGAVNDNPCLHYQPNMQALAAEIRRRGVGPD